MSLAVEPMIERVAAAIRARFAEGNPMTWVGVDDDLRCVTLDGEFDLIEAARAALEALG